MAATDDGRGLKLREFFERAELLDAPGLRERRPDWSDRLPRLHARPSYAARPLVRWHWSFLVPTGLRELYSDWLVRRRYRLNIEQIEVDELDEVATAATLDDDPDTLRAIYAKHATRRTAARFLVATTERRRLERLAMRWDVEAPKMIERGQANEAAIAQVRRAIREARWTFIERCGKLLIPILSLLVALAALLLNLSR
jgi:hypothetical protein